MEFLEGIAKKNKNLYWCYRHADGLPSDRIIKLVNRFKGYFIPIDGFDKTMLALFSAMDKLEYSLPYVDSEIKAQQYNDKYHETIHRVCGIPLDKQDTPLAMEVALKPMFLKNIEKLEHIIKNNNNSYYYYDLGFMYHVLREYNDAIKYYTEAISLDCNIDKYYSARGTARYYSKNYTEALLDETKAIELNPNIPNYYKNRAMTYYRISDYYKALTDADRAVCLDSDSADNYFFRGATYYVLTNYEKAHEDYLKAVELSSNNAKYHSALAMTYYKKDRDIISSMSCISKALDIDNKCAYAYRNRGRINLMSIKEGIRKCSKDILDEIAEDLTKAIELERIDWLMPANYVHRAKYYLYIKDYSKAYEDLKVSDALNNNNEDVWFYLSKYYEAKGNREKQKEYYDKAIEAGFIEEDDDYPIFNPMY